MPSEAINRDESFKASLSAPGMALGVLKYEYGMRTKLWREAMTGGLQWIGIPGLRGLGLGESRKFGIGGGMFNKLGINIFNRPAQRILSMIPAYKKSGYDLVSQGISGAGIGGKFFGNILGGYQSNILKVQGAVGRPAVTKALETNWIRAIVGNVTPERQEALNKLKISGLRKRGKFASASKVLGTRGVAIKFALSQRIAPAAIWASNLAFFASLTTPIFSAAGRFAAGGLEAIETFTERLNRKSLEFGGKIHMSYMNRTGLTERQRSLSELQRSRTNARTLIGQEAGLYHS